MSRPTVTIGLPVAALFPDGQPKRSIPVHIRTLKIETVGAACVGRRFRSLYPYDSFACMNTTDTASQNRPLTVLLSVGLLACTLLFAPSLAQAQIASDRPGLGDGAAVVAPRTVQAELGYQLGQASGNGTDATLHNFGQLFLRFGLTDYLELRAGIGSIGVLSVDGVDENASGYIGAGQGTSNFGTTLGTKVRLLETETATLSGLASISLPTTTGDFDTVNDRARQEVKGILDAALGSNLSLTVNAGANFFWSEGDDVFGSDREVEYVFIPTLNIGLTETTSAYVGYAGFYSDDSRPIDAANTNFVETGVTFLATPDTQIDLNGGLRVDDNVDSEFFVGVGLSQRF